MNNKEQAKKIQKIIARAWADDGFKQRLISNPSETLKGEGIEVPDGMDIRVVESTNDVHYFVLPPKPSDLEIAEGNLENRLAMYTHY